MVRVLGRKQRQGCGRSRSLPRAAVALSSFRACLFLEHAPHSPHSLTLLTLLPHQLLHVNRLQPIPRHLCSTSCHPPSHSTCPGFPVSAHRHPLYTAPTRVSPWPGASAQPPSPLRRPPDPSCSLLPFSLPILWAASPVIGYLRVPIRITLTPTRTLPRFSVTTTFSPKALSPVS
jgi:hypothetical protein